MAVGGCVITLPHVPWLRSADVVAVAEIAHNHAAVERGREAWLWMAVATATQLRVAAMAVGHRLWHRDYRNPHKGLMRAKW